MWKNIYRIFFISIDPIRYIDFQVSCITYELSVHRLGYLTYNVDNYVPLWIMFVKMVIPARQGCVADVPFAGCLALKFETPDTLF